MMEEQLDTLYEVYGKRVLHQGIEELPLLDRQTNKKKAEEAASNWGGCVVRVTCRVITWHPMQREVVRTKVIWVHTPPAEAGEVVGWRELKGKLQKYGRAPRRRSKKY